MEVGPDGKTPDERAEESLVDQLREVTPEHQPPRRQTLALERIASELERIAQFLEPIAKRETEVVERERYYERAKADSHEARVKRAEQRGKDVLEVGCPTCHVYMTVPCDIAPDERRV